MDNLASERTAPETKRSRIPSMPSWIGPAFLVAVVAVFIVAPWSFKGKLDAVCYGI